jgi:hypothetical protein
MGLEPTAGLSEPVPTAAGISVRLTAHLRTTPTRVGALRRPQSCCPVRRSRAKAANDAAGLGANGGAQLGARGLGSLHVMWIDVRSNERPDGVPNVQGAAAMSSGGPGCGLLRGNTRATVMVGLCLPSSSASGLRDRLAGHPPTGRQLAAGGRPDGVLPRAGIRDPGHEYQVARRSPRPADANQLGILGRGSIND